MFITFFVFICIYFILTNFCSFIFWGRKFHIFHPFIPFLHTQKHFFDLDLQELHSGLFMQTTSAMHPWSLDFPGL